MIYVIVYVVRIGHICVTILLTQVSSITIRLLIIVAMRPHFFYSDSLVPRIGHPAPFFKANSTQGPIQLSDYKGKWLILFSYPADFTPVCSSELKAFAKIYPELKELHCELVGVSIDSVKEHLNWIKCIEEEGSDPVAFPIVADLSLEISHNYGLLPNENTEEASRSLFVIDPSRSLEPLSC